MHGSTMRAAAAQLTLLLALGPAARAQTPAAGGFVATIGTGTLDTVAVEHYTRTPTRLIGSSAVANPRAQIRTYDVSFSPAGRVERIHLTAGAPGTPPDLTADYVYSGDSVTVTMHRDTASRRYAVATHGERPLPFFEDLFGFWEVAIGQAAAGQADSATLEALAGRQVLPITVVRRGPGRVDFGFPDWGTVHATLDAGHRFRRLDMTETTNKYTVLPASAVDVEHVAATWAARPQPGQLSPRDTAEAAVGAAHIVVDYGRPSMRGRKVFGGIVPWNAVWRTGANAATQLITDRDLEIGGTLVPAGTYSLFSLPTESGWTLIINSQHGQWGTEYHPEQDLARIPLTVTRLADPVERFTIAVTPADAGAGTLDLAWERTKGSVAVRVK